MIIISSYTVSKLGRFLRHSVVMLRHWYRWSVWLPGGARSNEREGSSCQIPTGIFDHLLASYLSISDTAACFNYAVGRISHTCGAAAVRLLCGWSTLATCVFVISLLVIRHNGWLHCWFWYTTALGWWRPLCVCTAKYPVSCRYFFRRRTRHLSIKTPEIED